MNEINNFLNEDQINNIFNQFSNVYVINYDKNAVKDKEYVGSVLLKVNIKKDKPSIKLHSFVMFRKNKIKWSNENICLVDPYWVKPFINNEKLNIKVEILKSKVDDDKRLYYKDYEYIELTLNQFIKRRILEIVGGKNSYTLIEAFFNFNERKSFVGYYKALNETSKHYLIEHEILSKKIIPQMNNLLKKLKKEWQELYIQEIKNDKAKQAIDQLIKKNKENKSANIIKLNSKTS